MNLDHGLLDKVGCGPLDGSINSHPFSLSANDPVLMEDIRQIPPPVEESGYIPFFSRRLDGGISVVAYSLVLLVIGRDVVLGALEVYAQRFAQCLGPIP